MDSSSVLCMNMGIETANWVGELLESAVGPFSVHPPPPFPPPAPSLCLSRVCLLLNVEQLYYCAKGINEMHVEQVRSRAIKFRKQPASSGGEVREWGCGRRTSTRYN